MPPPVDDRFFRDMVSSMRNGVLAVTSDGAVAVMNAEAYRIFGMSPDPADIGRPYAEVLRMHPDMVRVLAAAFGMAHLPNRVEIRLKSTDRVIGYTLSHIRDRAGSLTGIALFFKDLTHVEQLEERERLRDRLAALGEMAAAIAHELKNPLAGIEVMAGLLRRKVPDVARRAVDPDRHHQRGEDGERHGRRGARLRPPGAARGRADLHRRRRARGAAHRRRQGPARRRAGPHDASRRTCRRCTATGTSCVRCSRTS